MSGGVGGRGLVTPSYPILGGIIGHCKRRKQMTRVNLEIVSFVPAPISRLADGEKDITRRAAELCGIAHAKPAADGTSSTAGLRLFLLQT